VEEQLLPGGNTHAAVVRAGDTVRRPTGPWTPAIHDLLRHLERRGFGGAPRVLGIDEEGREVLTFLAGEVVYPDHLDVLTPDAALAEVAVTIRQYHDAVADFAVETSHEWSDRGGDPGGGEILCHNDLAPWNLIRLDAGGWGFIDWDLAAPGRRSWDLAWALLTLIPLTPDRGAVSDEAITERLRVFCDAYGATEVAQNVIDVAVERCEREAHLISTLGSAGVAPYDRLLVEGHGSIWVAAKDRVAAHAARWTKAAFG